MTPTEQDIEEVLLKKIKVIGEQEHSYYGYPAELIGLLADLITTEMKRVALEARIDSLLAVKRRIYETDAFELGLALGIIDSELKKLGWTPGELKAQQEDV